MNNSTAGLYGRRATRLHPQAKPAITRRSVRAAERQAIRNEIAEALAHLRMVSVR